MERVMSQKPQHRNEKGIMLQKVPTFHSYTTRRERVLGGKGSEGGGVNEKKLKAKAFVLLYPELRSGWSEGINDFSLKEHKG